MTLRVLLLAAESCGNIFPMTTVEAIYENGIFKPISGVPQSLREHSHVRIIIENDDDESLREELAEWDAASNNDLMDFEKSLGESS